VIRNLDQHFQTSPIDGRPKFIVLGFLTFTMFDTKIQNGPLTFPPFDFLSTGVISAPKHHSVHQNHFNIPESTSPTVSSTLRDHSDASFRCFRVTLALEVISNLLSNYQLPQIFENFYGFHSTGTSLDTSY
jgi:hypothetical protein